MFDPFFHNTHKSEACLNTTHQWHMAIVVVNPVQVRVRQWTSYQRPHKGEKVRIVWIDSRK